MYHQCKVIFAVIMFSFWLLLYFKNFEIEKRLSAAIPATNLKLYYNIIFNDELQISVARH